MEWLKSQILLFCATCFVGKVCSAMWSTWGASPWEGKSGAEVGIVNTKVARRANIPPILVASKPDVIALSMALSSVNPGICSFFFCNLCGKKLQEIVLTLRVAREQQNLKWMHNQSYANNFSFATEVTATVQHSTGSGRGTGHHQVIRPRRMASFCPQLMF